MPSETDLTALLKNLNPIVLEDDYVFCSTNLSIAECLHLKPIATFHEQEGLTLVLTMKTALANNMVYESTFRCITLTAQSSLNAVGLTSAVANILTQHNISANVIAAYYHDHIFVPSNRAEDALSALKDLSKSCITS